jgi:hypothetical protein
MSLPMEINGESIRMSKPVIGILTQPISEKKKDQFPFNEYILEVNKLFLEKGGATVVPISYIIG